MVDSASDLALALARMMDFSEYISPRGNRSCELADSGAGSVEEPDKKRDPV